MVQKAFPAFIVEPSGPSIFDNLIYALNAIFRYLLCMAATGLLLALCYAVIHANATTAALALLLLVLGVATNWGLPESIFTSVLAVLGFNYLFLPPIGNFTIADPQNWVALFAFLATAVTASQLSVRARRRAEEALHRREDVEHLYELSRAMLLEETGDSVKASMAKAATVFGIEAITFYELEGARTINSGTNSAVTPEVLANVARTGQALSGPGYSVIPVSFGTRTLGSLALVQGDISVEMRESIASLLAINYERARALDRALAAEAERRNENFKSALLDGLAHDLKTPLSAVRTCVTRLIEIPPRSEAVREELLSIIDQESYRLQQTITEAIELARIQSGKLFLQRTSVNVEEVILQALADARDEDQSRYRLDISPDLTVPADSRLLRQALKQILENAWKYTPAGSPVEIRAGSTDGHVWIGISDRGPGISGDELERIFQKFYRGQHNRRRPEGTGMGLAIAKGIIEAHGGTIRAENVSPSGAKFSITLPAHTK